MKYKSTVFIFLYYTKSNTSHMKLDLERSKELERSPELVVQMYLPKGDKNSAFFYLLNIEHISVGILSSAVESNTNVPRLNHSIT